MSTAGDKVECESKVEEGTSVSCGGDRVVNSGEPHVTFTDGGYTGAVYKAGDFLADGSLARTGFSVPTLNYGTPVTTTPKVMSSGLVGTSYPSTYSLGGQSAPYYSTTGPGTSSYVPQTVFSTAPQATAYYPSTVLTGAAPLSSRGTSQYPTYSTAKYPATSTYSNVPFDAAPVTTGQSYTMPAQTYTMPTQTYTMPPQSYTLPQSYTTAAQGYTLPAFHMPTVDETAAPVSYPAFGAYPASLQAYNVNSPGFSQEELASYYHSYLAAANEPLVDNVTTHKVCHSLNELPMTSPKPATTTQLHNYKKLPNNGKPQLRKKKGCCGC